jgi:hypothetical protein
VARSALRTTSLALLVAACTFDASGLTAAPTPTSTTAATTSDSTGPSDPTTSTTSTTSTSTGSTTSPVDPTTGSTTNPITSGSTGDPGTSTTSETDVTSGSTTDPGTSTTSTSTTDTTDTTSGTTGEPIGLVGDGLIVRYFLDEAASGQTPTMAVDAAPQPLALPLVYSKMGGNNPVYVEQSGQRGLSWTKIELDGRATIPVDTTKIQSRLAGSTTATIEVVVEIDQVSADGSRVSHIGAGSEPGWLTLRSDDIQKAQTYWQGDKLAGAWDVDWVAEGRAVVHLVYDTAQADPAARVRLCLDGQQLPDAADTVEHPTQNQTITIPATGMLMKPVHYTLGNRGEDVMRSFEDALFYAALYDVALSDGDIASNAALLGQDDDAPP